MMKENKVNKKNKRYNENVTNRRLKDGERGDTMAAITNANYAYIIKSDKENQKKIPVMDKKTLQSHIKAVEKYLKNDK